MSIADKLVEVAENVPKVFEAGKNEIISLHPEKTVRGSYLSVDDVSELPHDVKCKVSGVDNPQSVTVTRCGANLWKDAKTFEVVGNGTTIAMLWSLLYEGISDNVTLACWTDIQNAQFTETGNLVYLNVSFNDGTTQIMSMATDKSENGLIECMIEASPTKVIQRLSIHAHNRFTSGTITLSNVMLFETATAQSFTPSADGTVEGMTRTYPQMNIFTDNADAILDVTYRISAGKKAEYDAFWDNLQQKGTLTSYYGLFAGRSWNKETFKPKYKITPVGNTGAMYMFFGFNSLVNSEMMNYKEYEHMFDWSAATGFQQTFADAKIDNIDIDFSNAANIDMCFSESNFPINKTSIYLKTSEKTQSFSGTFSYCKSLKNLIFKEGSVIAANINVQHSPLTKESITSVINALSSTTSGKTVTIKKSAKEAAFTADEWAALIADKTNWTFSLV